MKKSFLLLLLTLLPMLVSAYEGESVGVYDNLITGNPLAEMQEVEAGDGDATETRLTGDVNGDGYLSIGDVTTLVETLQGRLAVEPFPGVADLNGDEAVTFEDVSLLVSMIMKKVKEEHEVTYQVYYGYSSAVPTSFSNKGTSNNTNIGTGPFTVRTTRENQAKCHWIMIPQGSGYSLNRVTDNINNDVTRHFILSEDIFTDGTTNYTMYYDYDAEGYYLNTSNFELTH